MESVNIDIKNNELEIDIENNDQSNDNYNKKNDKEELNVISNNDKNVSVNIDQSHQNEKEIKSIISNDNDNENVDINMKQNDVDQINENKNDQDEKEIKSELPNLNGDKNIDQNDINQINDKSNLNIDQNLIVNLNLEENVNEIKKNNMIKSDDINNISSNSTINEKGKSFTNAETSNEICPTSNIIENVDELALQISNETHPISQDEINVYQNYDDNERFESQKSQNKNNENNPELKALKKIDSESIQLQQEGRYTEALECMEKGLVLRQHFFGSDSKEVWDACKTVGELCNLLAMTYLQQEEFPTVLELLKKAEILTEKDLPGSAVTLNNLACFHRRQGNLHSALTCLTKALKIELKLDNIPNRADTHLNMCAVLSQLGQHQSALEQSQSALILLHEELFSGGENNDEKIINEKADRVAVLAIAYHNVGVEHEFLKKPLVSMQSYKKGAEIAEKYLGSKHGIVITLKNSLLSLKSKAKPKMPLPSKPQLKQTKLYESFKKSSIKTKRRKGSKNKIGIQG